MIRSIPQLLSGRAADQAPAIQVLGREPLTYAGLARAAGAVGEGMAALGLGRGDRVGIALPTNANTAVALLGVASHATAAPLNPAYRRSEFEFYLSDLGAKALLVPVGELPEARAAAEAQGVMVVDVVPHPQGAIGQFRLAATTSAAERSPELAQPDDIALVLHTSGTTARPKIVPLTHTALCLTGSNIAHALALTRSDRCLNVMPLFHVHGILNALLSSLIAGGTTLSMPGFDPRGFWHWLEQLRPTWYSAVPTIHQTILMHRPQPSASQPPPGAASLRFVRSSSAPLAPAVAIELEALFDAPVIESYGMSEVDQIATNPLPPQRRKLGSVGLPGGPEVVVMDTHGTILPSGQVGEVAVRGENVLKRYEASDAINSASFEHGYFHTGDLGYFDEDGYLYLVGRLKEIINRGGEKIAPREIDDTLLGHPAVAEAAAFAVAHPQLGEDVSAAVVLRQGTQASPLELREFVSRHLADFKVPRTIHFVDALPKGPTGKLKRLELSKQYEAPKVAAALESAPSNVATGRATALERSLLALWEEVLGITPIHVDDDFLAIGGTSLLATRLFARIESQFGRDLPIEAVLESSTVRELANALAAEGWSVSSLPRPEHRFAVPV